MMTLALIVFWTIAVLLALIAIIVFIACLIEDEELRCAAAIFLLFGLFCSSGYYISVHGRFDFWNKPSITNTNTVILEDK